MGQSAIPTVATGLVVSIATGVIAISLEAGVMVSGVAAVVTGLLSSLAVHRAAKQQRVALNPSAPIDRSGKEKLVSFTVTEQRLETHLASIRDATARIREVSRELSRQQDPFGLTLIDLCSVVSRFAEQIERNPTLLNEIGLIVIGFGKAAEMVNNYLQYRSLPGTEQARSEIVESIKKAIPSLEEKLTEIATRSTIDGRALASLLGELFGH